MLLLAGSNDFRRFPASSRQRARSLRVGLQPAYDRMVARWPHLDLIELVCHRPQQGIVAGLLVIAVLLGAVDVAMKSSSARGSKTQLTKSVVRKSQDVDPPNLLRQPHFPPIPWSQIPHPT